MQSNFLPLKIRLAETERVELSHRFTDFTAFEAANHTIGCLQFLRTEYIVVVSKEQFLIAVSILYLGGSWGDRNPQ